MNTPDRIAALRANIADANPAAEVTFPLAPAALAAERRDLDTSTASGLVGTDRDDFANAFVAALTETALVTRLGVPVVPTESGASATGPVVTGTPTAVIVGEGLPPTAADVTMAGATFSAFKYVADTVISSELMDDAPLLIAVLARIYGEAIGTAFGIHALTGTGTSQPEGLTIGATAGHTAASTTLTADDFKALAASVAPHLRERGAWVMNTNTANDARDLSIWQPARSEGERPLLLDRPVYVDDSLHDTSTLDSRPILFGHFPSAYVVRSVSSVAISYAGTGPDRFDTDTFKVRAKARLDGRVVDTRAVKAMVMPSA